MAIKEVASGFEVRCEWRGKKSKRYRATSLSAAAELEKRVKLAMVRGKAAPEVLSEDAAYEAMTLRELVQFMGSAKWRHHKTQTQASLVAALVERLGEDRPVSDITTRTLTKLGAELSNEGKCGATVNRYMSAFAAMLKQAERLGAIETAPTWERLPERESRTYEFSRAQIASLWQFADQAGKPVAAECCMFAAETGMRQGEILALRWSDVDTARWIVTVRNTKSRQERFVPLTKVARQCVEAVMHLKKGDDGDAVVFPGVHRVMLQRVVNAWKAHEGIEDPDCCFHALRHYAATQLIREGGASLEIVRRIMGHQSTQTTLRYLRFGPSDLTDHRDRLDALRDAQQFAEAS